MSTRFTARDIGKPVRHLPSGRFGTIYDTAAVSDLVRVVFEDWHIMWVPESTLERGEFVRVWKADES